MIAFTNTLTKDDYASFYVQMLWVSKEKIKKDLKQRAVGVFYYGFIAFALNNIISGEYFSTGFFCALILLGIIFIVPFFSMKSTLRKQAVKQIEEPLNEISLLLTHYEFYETGFFVKTDKYEARYTWKAIVKKEETDNHYFLLIGSQQGFIIPKKIFANEASKKDFDKLLSTNLSFEADINHLIKE